MDAASREVLQDLFRKESRSLLAYIADANPWTTQPARRERVQALAREEQEALGTIARHLLRQHILPVEPTGYPANFTTLNFVALEHLLPFLVDYERNSIQELERARQNVADPAARRLLDDYLDMKRRHLQALSAPDTAPVAPAAPAHH
jgi:hypothetical protein